MPTKTDPPGWQLPRRCLVPLLTVVTLVISSFFAGCQGSLRSADSQPPTAVIPISGLTQTAVIPTAAPTQISGTPLPPAPAADAPPAETATPQIPTPLPWDGSERVNILVLGIDGREAYTPADAPRTDTMILLTLDPVAKTAGMLSLPRDLWVAMPGFRDPHRINTAYRFGEMYQLPGGGAGLAVETVSELVDLPIQYYVLLDFNSFVRLIDALGGLQIHIREEITVDPLGPGNTVLLEPGVQPLDGATVLAYARNRHTSGGDFDRIDRQHEILMAIREQVLRLELLPKLLQNAPLLVSEVASGAQTNLSLDQIVRLAWLARQVPAEQIQQPALQPVRDLSFARIETAEGAQEVLLLKPGRMAEIRKQLLGEP